MFLGWCTCQHYRQRLGTFSRCRVIVNTQCCWATDPGWVQEEHATPGL